MFLPGIPTVQCPAPNLHVFTWNPNCPAPNLHIFTWNPYCPALKIHVFFLESQKSSPILGAVIVVQVTLASWLFSTPVINFFYLEPQRSSPILCAVIVQVTLAPALFSTPVINLERIISIMCSTTFLQYFLHNGHVGAGWFFMIWFWKEWKSRQWVFIPFAAMLYGHKNFFSTFDLNKNSISKQESMVLCLTVFVQTKVRTHFNKRIIRHYRISYSPCLIYTVCYYFCCWRWD